MIEFTGYWTDGKTSSRISAVCRVSVDGRVRIEQRATAELLRGVEAFDARVSPRLGDTPRYLTFPDGTRFETDDNEAVDALLSRLNLRPWTQIIHALESRWHYILAALVLMVLIVWGTVQFGVPLTARLLAARFPGSIMNHASEKTLQVLDQKLLGSSGLTDEVKTRLNDHFQPLITDSHEANLRVIFRKGGRIGANAFALPDGTIIFTDEMVKMAVDDDELLAVMAHETGHVVCRHGMRTLIQDSLLSFILLALTGDVSGTSELFLGLPVLLTQLSYSREFEREADQYALDWLRSRQISPVHFANLIRRMDEAQRETSGSGERRWTGYLSTHPLNEERMARFEE